MNFAAAARTMPRNSAGPVLKRRREPRLGVKGVNYGQNVGKPCNSIERTTMRVSGLFADEEGFAVARGSTRAEHRSRTLGELEEQARRDPHLSGMALRIYRRWLQSLDAAED